MLTSSEYRVYYSDKVHSASVEVELLRGLPSEVGVVATEVTESGCLLVDGSLQVELLDNVTRSEVKVVAHNSANICFGASIFSSAIGVDMDGQRVGQADSVRHLEESSVAKTGGDERLGDKARIVSSRPVHLCGVFA